MKKFSKNIIVHTFIKYFLEGMLVIVPFSVTFYLVFYGVSTLHEKLCLVINLVPPLAFLNKIPGVNILLVILLICFFGYIATSFLLRSIIDLLERLMLSLPLVSILYSYIKESTSAFVEKFDRPVLVIMNKRMGVEKLGFITQNDLSSLERPDLVAIYLPHSYAFSGEVIFVPKEHVSPLPISGTEALRIVLSGGLAERRRVPALRPKARK